MSAPVLIVFLVTTIVVVASIWLIIALLREEVGPDEMLVLYGGERKTPSFQLPLIAEPLRDIKGDFSIFTDGTVVPMLEQMERVDVSPFEIRLELADVRTRDGTRIPVSGCATVAVDMTPKRVEQFVELFLGRPRDEIASGAEKTLEAHLRDLVSRLDIEELETRRDEASDRLAKTVVYDLELLGLELESLSLDDR